MPSRSIQHQYRRLWLTLLLISMGFIAGYLWGQMNGYIQGKQDMLKTIETRLNEPAPRPAL